jgi:hypothetical protein
MRCRLDENRLPQMPFPPMSDSLEREFDSLLARIDEVRRQFDVGIAAAEEALSAVRAMRNVERVAIGDAPR